MTGTVTGDDAAPSPCTTTCTEEPDNNAGTTAPTCPGVTYKSGAATPLNRAVCAPASPDPYIVITSPGATAPARLLAALVTALTEMPADTGDSMRTALLPASAT